MLRFFLTLTVVVASLGGVIGAAAVPVEAQNATNSTATPTETPTGDQTTISLSPTTTVDRWRFENGSFHVTLSSQVPVLVTVTDAGKLSKALGEGSGAATTRVRQRTINVESGTTTLQFRATEYDGAHAITLSANNGDGLAAIRTDSMGGDRRAVNWDTTAGLVLGAAVITAIWTFRKARERWEDEKKEVERIA